MRLLRLRYILPILMTALYVALVASSPAQYYIGYEKLRGTYVVIGMPPLSHRAAYTINAPAVSAAMLVLRFKGRLTGVEEETTVGILVPILWFLVGAFLDRALRDRSRLLRIAVLGGGAVALFVPVLIDAATNRDVVSPRYVTALWILFAIWVLWERSRWRRAVKSQ